jgi:hypothetical protein
MDTIRYQHLKKVANEVLAKDKQEGSAVASNVGLSDNEALLIKKLIEEQEKRVVYCEKVLNGKFGRFQRLNALNSIKLLKRILNEGR